MDCNYLCIQALASPNESSANTRMEVTKDNFVSTWPLMEQSIRNAEFVAIDTELTGLHDAGEEERYHDTLNERFERMKTSASKVSMATFAPTLMLVSSLPIWSMYI